MFRPVLLCILLVCPGFASEIHLSPNGPIATPESARDAARKVAKPVRIVVESGVYPLKEPLSLGEEDSQVTWEAAPGTRPVFSGGCVIRGWREAGGGLWKAKVPGPEWKFEQLWVNGRRAVRARTPNQGYDHIADAVDPGVFPGLDKDVNFHAFAVAPEPYAMLKAVPEPERDEVLLTVTHAWAVGQCRIAALDDSAQAVRIKGRAAYPFVVFEPDQRYWMENFRAALDAPGEWYLDAVANEVCYLPLPGEDLKSVEVTAPRTDKLVIGNGVRDLTLRGLSFQHGNYLYPEAGMHDAQAAVGADGAVEFQDSSGIRLENCEFARLGLHGVYFRNGCSGSVVRHCHFHDLGGGGVRIGESKRPDEARVNHHIVVDDCIIHHAGRLHPSACGVFLTHTRNCSVRHCDIADLYYTGISAGWNWGYGESLSRETLVENNHIHHLGWAYLSDMGGYYGLGTSPGTVIRGNHIHHIASHRYGGWGLYNDEGSTDTLMEQNLVHDTSNAGFHQHYGYANIVRNNIFAFGRSAQIQRSRNEDRLSFKFERNVVVWDPAAPLLDGGEWNWKLNLPPDPGEPRDTTIFRNNLYWPTDGNLPAHLTKGSFTWEQWRGMGRDAGSLFADPQFEDLVRRDFRLKAGSPAAKVGFKPWDLTLAGVRKEDSAWLALAAEGHHYPTWEREAKPWPVPEYRVEELTFESTPPGRIGIRNARYSPPREETVTGQGFAVVEEVSSRIPFGRHPIGRRSLKAQDMPGLVHSYDPVLDIHPNWTSGRFRVQFDLMAEPGAGWFFEMRDKGGEFAAGPFVRWINGNLVANNTNSVALASVKPGEWVRIAIVATTGAGEYAVTVTREDGTTKEFPSIPCKASWKVANYLLFSGQGTEKAAFFIDNLTLAPQR
ncbi:MAG: Right handed beta helix region/Right handed beta helix region [Verrucomicrobia bacterium]|nr:MAG: Right handed beta helix region/Right handed beta helix region [Verrucomicrobiota bacterium]